MQQLPSYSTDSGAGADLATLAFQDSFIRSLAPDAESRNFVRQVAAASYSLVTPTPVAAPRLLAWSDDCGALVGVSRPTTDADLAVRILGGNGLAPGMRPYAARYGGHQFGNWAGQLGDGRAITLGELIAPRRRALGAAAQGRGPTPYSRTADGRAVLRSSIREFLCSEAMHFLGVPTTRALWLVATGDAVIRDMFYDGHPQPEPGAIVCRVAPSFLRFGNFEILAARGETRRCCSSSRTTSIRDTSRSSARRRPRRVRALVRRGRAAHGGDGRALDARGLRARRDEHGQHVDPRAHHRLRAVWLARGLRPRGRPTRQIYPAGGTRMVNSPTLLHGILRGWLMRSIR